MKAVLLTLFFAVMMVGTNSFASAQKQLKMLGSAWKSQSTIHPKQEQNDIAIVYGGADISRKPTLIPHTTTA